MLSGSTPSCGGRERPRARLEPPAAGQAPAQGVAPGPQGGADKAHAVDHRVPEQAPLFALDADVDCCQGLDVVDRAVEAAERRQA